MSSFTVNLGYCKLLIDYLSARGYELAPTLQKLEISREEMSNCDVRVSRQAFLTAFDAALTLTGDPYLGLHAGEEVRPNHFGVLGLISMGCENGRQLLDYRSRWHQLVADGETWEVRAEGGGLRLIRSSTAPKYVDSRPSIECGAAAQIILARWLSGRNFDPQRICFPYAQPDDLSEYQRIFRCDLQFDAAVLEMQLSADFLKMPLLQGNPELLRAMVARAERLATAQGIHEEPLIGEIRQLIAQRVANQVPEIDDAATSLGMTTRQLQSRLADAGTHYKKILDETRKQLALGYIDDRENSLTDVAFLLGFSEQSAFNHAFKRWTSRTPSEYRRNR